MAGRGCVLSVTMLLVLLLDVVASKLRRPTVFTGYHLYNCVANLLNFAHFK